MKKVFFISLVILVAGIFVACNWNAKNQQTKNVYYNVYFVTSGSTAVETQQVKENEKATEPEDPVRTDGSKNKYFEGWYIDEDFSQRFDFETPVTKDLYLYAKWVIIPEGYFFVNFNSYCDTKVESQIVAENAYAQEPEIELKRDGYAFSHWYISNPEIEFDFSQTPITDTVDLSAKWNNSGIYEAGFEDDSLYLINLYDTFEADLESGAW